jgi:hypothetical protein
VVSAIANQTMVLKHCVGRAIAGDLVDDLKCSFALKWVAHFLGDVAQPLHASGVAAGGNSFDVIFGNRSTELHAVSNTTLTLLFFFNQKLMLLSQFPPTKRSGMVGSSTQTQT